MEAFTTTNKVRAVTINVTKIMAVASTPRYERYNDALVFTTADKYQ
jgi:hypothetical protein